MTNKVGQPKIELEYDKFDALMQHRISKKYCAEYLGISETTIDTRLREDHDMTFTEYHKHRMERVSNKLQNKAIEMAMGGNTAMIIFCLKNISQWKDKIDLEIDGTINITDFTSWAKKMNKQLEEESKLLDVTPKGKDEKNGT